MQRRLLSVVGEPNERGLIIPHGSPADLAQELGQAGIGLHEPAAKIDAVRLVDDAVWIKLVQLTENGLSHQLGVQRGHTIASVRAHEREMPHPQASAALIDQRDRGQHVVGVGTLLSCKPQVLLVDAINNLQMSRQHAFE